MIGLMTVQNPVYNINYYRSQARVAALQFLYQCECEQIMLFSEGLFVEFRNFMILDAKVSNRSKDLINFVFARRLDIDEFIRKYAKNWTIERMSVVDRSILRLCVAELLMADTPYKVVLDESINLAKTFGSENSPQFVNGIADQIAKNILHSKKHVSDVMDEGVYIS